MVGVGFNFSVRISVGSLVFIGTCLVKSVFRENWTEVCRTVFLFFNKNDPSRLKFYIVFLAIIEYIISSLNEIESEYGKESEYIDLQSYKYRVIV